MQQPRPAGKQLVHVHESPCDATEGCAAAHFSCDAGAYELDMAAIDFSSTQQMMDDDSARGDYETLSFSE